MDGGTDPGGGGGEDGGWGGVNGAEQVGEELTGRSLLRFPPMRGQDMVQCSKSAVDLMFQIGRLRPFHTSPAHYTNKQRKFNSRELRRGNLRKHTIYLIVTYSSSSGSSTKAPFSPKAK